MIQFKYRPDIDGLRAVAVLLVVLFHAGLGFSGGFVGVDIFFVISGYLITGLILKEKDAASFSLIDFWHRRIKRIIPAATAMILVVLFAGYFLLLPSDYADLGKSGIAQQLMVSNLYFWQSTGYFDGPADLKPLLHTWSLSVEEQFYLFYPFLLIFLHRFGHRVIFLVVGLLSIGSLIVSQYGVVNHPGAAFYFLPTRAWELLIGGIICLLPAPSRVKPWIIAALSWISLMVIFVVGLYYSPATPFPGLTAIIPCAAAAVLIYSNSLRLSFPARLLATKPLVFIGLISYSLYLWHWPIFAFTRYWAGQHLSFTVTLIAIAASFSLALASWWFIELPFRTKSSRSESGQGKRIHVFANAFLSLAVVLGLSYSIYALKGIPSRLATEVAYIIEGHVRQCAGLKVSSTDVRSDKIPTIGKSLESGQTPDFVLWGDSHALAMAKGFDEVANKKGLSGVIAVRAGTIPILNVSQPQQQIHSVDTVEWNDEILEFVRRSKTKNIFLVARWASYVDGLPNGKMKMCVAEKRAKRLTKKATKKVFSKGLRKSFKELESMGVKVWIFKQIPLQKFDPQKMLVKCTFLGAKMPKGISRSKHRRRQNSANSIIDRQSAKYSNVRVVDLSEPFFDRKGHSKLGNRKGSFYADDNHISDHGATTIVRPLLKSVMLELGK